MDQNKNDQDTNAPDEEFVPGPQETPEADDSDDNFEDVEDLEEDEEDDADADVSDA
jgi:hypothetical protein